MTIRTRRSKLDRKYKSPKDGYTANEIIGLATNILGEQWVRDSASVTDPNAGKAYLKTWLSTEPSEVFAVVYLDGRHRVLSSEIVFRGTIDGASVHPREIVRRALAHNAAAVIVAHNHPSGVAEPSAADIAITRRLADALALVDVRLLDHFVIGDDEPISMASRGLL